MRRKPASRGLDLRPARVQPLFEELAQPLARWHLASALRDEPHDDDAVTTAVAVTPGVALGLSQLPEPHRSRTLGPGPDGLLSAQHAHETPRRDDRPDAFEKEEAPLILDVGVNRENEPAREVEHEVQQRLRIPDAQLRQDERREDCESTRDLHSLIHSVTLAFRPVAQAKVFEYAVEVDRAGRMTVPGGAQIAPPEGWSPDHLLLAALVRCSIDSLVYHARRSGHAVRASGFASGTVTKRSDGRYGFVDITCTIDAELSPRASNVDDLLMKAERDCFVGASLTVEPSYEWRVT
jgi:hypothetical protein